MNTTELKSLINKKVIELGFDLFGVCTPTYSPSDHDHLLNWLANGYQGEMAYLERAPRQRFDPALFFKDVKSIVLVGASYYKKPGYDKTKPYVSLYARGKPYQQVIREKLEKLLAYVKKIQLQAEGKTAVDTSPTTDKLWGQLAGLGWRGKNTILINRQIGSFFFLGELFLNIELPPDKPGVDHCGSCTKCLESCPTGALVAPHTLNASRCISYITIETKSSPADPAIIGNHVLGCDLCQLVCLFNKSPLNAAMPEFQAQFGQSEIDTFAENISESEFNNRFGGTVLAEYGFNRVTRNLKIAKRNISNI